MVGIRVTVALGSRLRGNDVEEAQGRRVMQRSTFAGTTWGRRKDDELCKGLLSRERQEWPWGRRERARRLLATLVGIRVTVALGSRLRGNDVGEAQGRRVMQRSPFAGTTGVAVETAGTGEEVVGDLGWYPSDGCAGFPPSRERRGGGARTTSYATVYLRGNDVGEAQGRRVMQRSPFAGTTGVAVGTAGTGEEVVGHLGWYPSDGCAGFPPSRQRRGGGARTTSYATVYLPGNDVGEAQGRRVMQRSPFAGTTGVAVETAGTGEEVVGDLGWYPSDGCAGFPPSRERRGGGARTTSYATVYLRGNDVEEAQGRRVMQRSTFAGTTGVAVETAGTGEEIVGDLGWYASDGCARFPPSRERRGGGARTTSYAKVYLRGNDRSGRGDGGNGRGDCWRPWLVSE